MISRDLKNPTTPYGNMRIILELRFFFCLMEKLLRRREVEEITGFKKSCIYKMMQEGRFPRPKRIGPASVRWPASVVQAWIEQAPTDQNGGAGIVSNDC